METDLLKLVRIASDAARQNRELGGPWTCVCGKENRAKDTRCWDYDFKRQVPGCQRTRQEGEVS